MKKLLCGLFIIIVVAFFLFKKDTSIEIKAQILIERIKNAPLNESLIPLIKEIEKDPELKKEVIRQLRKALK